ncbi:putative bifunctional diguanylate cyclase/phosphodiesterase [Mongoliimonas terrestris]|uniref:putative bifunctional diguanylate cyclase/phosphodiesterase n=1 Tax=Mongoliimonas terrestris TaxID=1709001 RepID=UPI0009495C85|nr:GGDEF domain-containing phosphodiesterase [Mongoliimonas terrestris]
MLGRLTRRGAAPAGSTAGSGLVELLSIAGICAVLISAEFRYGLLSGIAATVSTAVPFGNTLIVAAVAALWVGMGTFSVRRRVELSSVLADRERLKSDYEAHKITDTATGLPNTLGFNAYLTDLLETDRPDVFVTLIGVEIGNLTLIRDVHGAAVEAAVELAIADRLVTLLGAGDFAARGSGSTFYVVTSGPGDVSVAAADRIVADLIETFRLGLTVGAAAIPAKLHVGTTAARAGAIGAERLVEQADLAIHHSRRKGPGAVSAFDADMKVALEHRAMIETSLAGALRANEIVPYFQPLIDLSRNKVSGFEVLARWTHPTVGAISPAVFIPIADEIGVLGPLTLDLLGKACKAAEGWGDDIKLAVNVSPTALRNPAFMDGFRDVLEASRFDPRRLEVEITENAFIEEVTGLDKVIAGLKSDGISISIDDFGTGYSSLHRLRMLPFDKIKIDQSFVKDMMNNADSRRIVEAIISLGQSLGLPTTAEGIEAESNRSLLERLGCTIGQGYLFAPAMPAAEVPDFLARYTREGVAVLRRTA